MEKILLIGDLGEIARSLNECLSDTFQVQLCTEQLPMIESMAKIVKPDLMVFCQIGIDDIDHAFFVWVKDTYPKTPVLVISTSEDWKKIKNYCRGMQFFKVFRPVSREPLIDYCKAILENPSALAEREHSEQMETPVFSEKSVQTTATIDYGASSQRKKIMVVDDSPLVLRNIKTVLEESYQVFLAPSGEKALELIPKKKPDLVLLDYEMPGMDGKMIFEAMLEDEYMSQIPVIFLTSISQKDRVYGVLKSVPAGYILKPADKDRLYHEIWRVLNHV